MDIKVQYIEYARHLTDNGDGSCPGTRHKLRPGKKVPDGLLDEQLRVNIDKLPEPAIVRNRDRFANNRRKRYNRLVVISTEVRKGVVRVEIRHVSAIIRLNQRLRIVDEVQWIGPAHCLPKRFQHLREDAWEVTRKRVAELKSGNPELAFA